MECGIHWTHYNNVNFCGFDANLSSSMQSRFKTHLIGLRHVVYSARRYGH